MPGRTITAAEVMAAARAAATDWRSLLQVSRPISWVRTGLPFLVGALDAERAVTPVVLLGTLYFLGPYNLVLRGVTHVVDAAADDPGRTPPAAAPAPGTAATWFAIVATNLPFLLVLGLLGGPVGTLALALTVAVAVVWAAPPVRTRGRPVLDAVTRAMHVVLPAVCGLLIGGRSLGDLPWVVLLAFTLWAMASHALGAIGDIRADREGRIESIATALGPRVTAALALGGYALVVVLAASSGPLGALAAAGLSLHLLLPTMILSAGSDPAGQDVAAERVRRASSGLDLLVGSWLTVLLLRHWGVGPSTPWEVAIAVPTALVAYAFASIVATRIATRRRAVPVDGAADRVPSVTIVVPCHDGAERLPATLAALREQTYADTTVLVVDDGSSDGSATEGAAWLGSDAVLSAPPRPDGWSGKDWACHVGAAAATTDLLLFIDVGTVLAPIATRILVEQMLASDAALLSGVPRVAAETAGGNAGIPGFPMLLFGFVPVWWSALTSGRPPALAFAYGPLTLVRREAYLGTGGAAVDPESPLGDVALARRVAAAGHRVRTVHAADLGASRYDRDIGEAIDTWRRTFMRCAGGSLAVAIATVLVEVVAFLVPLLLPLLVAVAGGGPAVLAMSFVPVLLLVAARLALTITQRLPLRTIPWHPVTVIVMVIGQVAGIADHVLGRDPHAHR